ncbi:MAG: hypothetical protein ACXWFZ_04490 [Nitrososphaeraceae archaeon]
MKTAKFHGKVLLFFKLIQTESSFLNNTIGLFETKDNINGIVIEKVWD